jgi:hypothetical protein
MRKYNTVLTAERLRELLNYDPLTGVFSWRVNGRGRSGVGTVAGGSNHKYKRIAIDKKEYFVHRLAWLYVHGCWPTEDIDHINGDPSDNRIANLREATPSQNVMCARRAPRGRTGYRGVFLHHTGKFFSRIGGRHLGVFETTEQAASAYRRAAKEHYGEFAPQGIA